MLVDYHLHTRRSGHAEGEPDDYVAVARRVGIDEIGFAEHCMVPGCEKGFDESNKHWMDWSEIDDYFEELKALGEASRFPVRIGFEVDYCPGEEERTRRALASFSPDFVTGAVHNLPGIGPLYTTEFKDPASTYRKYFEVTKCAVESGLFDIIAHPNLVWRMCPWPEKEALGLLEQLEDLLATVRAADVCLEVNSRAMLNEGYSSTEFYRWFIRRLAENGIRVTMGSDSHRAHEVGRFFPEVVELLKDEGHSQIAVFRGRVRRMVPLDERY